MRLKTFGYRLSALRAERGLSRGRLADMAGVPLTTLFGYEHGKRAPGLRNLVKIREALGCTWDELLEGVVP